MRRLSVSPLPTGASLWYKAVDGLWWSGKISGRQDAFYVVRLLDDAGLRPLLLSPDRYSTALNAVCGSWCLEKHRSRPLGEPLQRPTRHTPAPARRSEATPPPLPSAVPG
ncbi:unnamed protein product [Pylaiella littoralis]